MSRADTAQSYPEEARVWRSHLARLWPGLVGVVLLLWLWGLLIDHLRVRWSADPRYAYGWAVPWLCGYLLWRRLRAVRPVAGGSPEGASTPASAPRNGSGAGPSASLRFPSLSWIALGVWGVIYALTRLVQEANPEWALVSWALALLVVSFTLGLLRQWIKAAGGPAVPGQRFDSASAPLIPGLRTVDFGFPIAFFLVAVPWPYALEHPIIQALTRLNAGLAVETLGWLGVPAVQHGNVIEVSTGSVGIDEACSGIRSLQATFMLALFFGECYRLGASRRVLCVGAGIALAMICNFIRTVALTWVAAGRGVEAIAGWHDPAGVSILVACFVGLWLLSLALRTEQTGANGEAVVAGSSALQGVSAERRPLRSADQSAPRAGEAPRVSEPASESVVRRFARFALGVWSGAPQTVRLALGATAVWLAGVELGVAAWYRHLEVDRSVPVTWSVRWPEDAAGFREVPIAPEAAALLRADEARQVQWRDAAGARWQLSWFRWKPGWTAAYLAKSHNPLVCMPAAGYTVRAVSAPIAVEVPGLRLPCRIYTLEREGHVVHGLYTRWDDQAREQPFAREGLSGFNRLRSVWEGRGTHGQRALSLALWGAPDPQQARAKLARQLQRLVVVNSP